MRSTALMTALLALAAPTLSAVKIDKAMARHLAEEQFQTAGEFLTGNASDGPRLVLRSQPMERTGLYFIVELSGDRSALKVDTLVEVEVIRSDSKDTYKHHFFLGTEKIPRGVIYIGLTGADWPTSELQPLAWRIRLRTLEGQELAVWKSFLWEM